MNIQTALLSVSDKRGIVELASGLREEGVRIISTGGTARLLRQKGIEVTSVSDHTGFPEILGGRVKTLHPRVHGGILARLEKPEDIEVLEANRIPPIGLVVVNLYPFVETIGRPGVTMKEALEQIDIGGPTMIRAAAKNHEHVLVVVDPDDYGDVVENLANGDEEEAQRIRRTLAGKAYGHTAAYDAAIAEYFRKQRADRELPERVNLSLELVNGLRYGENPHQRGALYSTSTDPVGLVGARQLQGKTLSFNNYLDLEAAWSLCSEFDDTTCAIVKHNNPCGAATAGSAGEAYERALACDPVSAFGSIIAFNRPVDQKTAEELLKLFVEAIIAPEFLPEAIDVLSRKKRLRLMETGNAQPSSGRLDYRPIDGGFVVQDSDSAIVSRDELRPVTRRRPSDRELEDLLFAWKVSKHVKSNAIVYASERRTVGIGAGQMSRIDSVQLAARKAQLPVEGSVMASDAFFPFRDGLDEAAKVGIRAVIQPGGSVRDQEVIDVADEHDIAMVFTGMRHFRH